MLSCELLPVSVKLWVLGLGIQSSVQSAGEIDMILRGHYVYSTVRQ